MEEVVLPFTAEDYNENEGKPHLDENGIQDAELSHNATESCIFGAGPPKQMMILVQTSLKRTQDVSK